MSPAAIAFLLLVFNQLIATGTFMVLYGLRSNWRNSTVGWHVMFWTAGAGILDVSWLLLLLWRQEWLVYLLLLAQAAVGVVTWQRVVLVWRVQHTHDGEVPVPKE